MLISWNNALILAMAVLLYFFLRVRHERNVLAEAEERYRISLLGSRDGLWDFDLENQRSYLNHRWFEVLGYHEQDGYRDLNWVRGHLHPDDAPHADKSWDEHLRGEVPFIEFETRLRHADGSWVWALIRGKVTRHDAKGQPLRITGTVTDISRQKEVEVRLKEAQDRLGLLMNFAPVGLFLTDQQGQCQFVNRAWSEYTGRGLLEALGSGWVEAIHTDDRQKVFNEWSQSCLEKRDFQLDYRFLDSQGASRNVIGRSTALHGAKGELLGYLGAVQDLTGVKRAEEKALAYRRALDATDIVSFADAEARITHINERFSEVFEYSPEELMGHNHGIISSGIMGTEHYRLMWEHVKTGQVWKGEVCNQSRSGRQVWVDNTIIPAMSLDGRIEGYISIQHDISDKKRQEEILSQALVRAESATRAKSMFLANMSHEIRTPLNGILGMVEILADSKLTDDQHEKVMIIKECGDNLLSLISDILDLTKIEADKLELECRAFSLRTCVDGIIAVMRQKSEAKGINLSCTVDPDVPLMVMGDQIRFRQILLNLVSNAVKFTERGQVQLMIQGVPTESNKMLLNIHVKDTGIGMNEAQVQRLFEPFQQADSSMTRKFGGTGLGLNITRRLCELMGGRVLVESLVGQGSTFTCQIPFAVAEIRVSPPKVNAEPSLPLGKYDYAVLLVEDNELNQVIGRNFLERLFARVEVAGNGSAALQWVERVDFDFVFMDLHMPDMDGIETTQRILANKGQKAPVIMAMTAAVFKEDVDRCMAAGMKAYLTKPLKVEAIRQTLEAWLAHQAKEPAEPYKKQI